jgi:tRNA-2-methylthio-N6-dimethylallyladenosine synthase
MKKHSQFYIKTYGCQMNVRDSEVIAGLLRKAGYKLTDVPEKADIVILNTCSVRQHAEDKVWSEVGRLIKTGSGPGRKTRNAQRKTRPIIGLVGCMAQNYKAAVFERAPEVDFVVGPSDIDKVPKLLHEVTKSQGHKDTRQQLFERRFWETEGTVRPEEIYHTGYYEDKHHAYVVISEGCSNYCSYCVVPYVRGELHNRDHRDILKEIEEAVKAGITSVTLLGQNVNAYVSEIQGHQDTKTQGHKLKFEFVDLLKEINKIEGIKEFSFITSHPRDTSADLFKTMATMDKLKKYLHLPVQAGSDRILKLMNRGYTRNFYLELTRNYRTIVKNGVLTTDIIVGFPGETNEDFRDTYNLVKEVRFDAAYIFKYSPRPHSDAFGWADSVPKDEKERRHKLILDLQKKISLEKRK